MKDRGGSVLSARATEGNSLCKKIGSPGTEIFVSTQIALGGKAERRSLDLSEACLYYGDVMFWNRLSQCWRFVKSKRA